MAAARSRVASPAPRAWPPRDRGTRRSDVTRPGTTLGEFGSTSRRPTVPTCRPWRLAAISRTASTSCDAATQRVLPAVHRRGAGVVGHALDHHVVAMDGDDAFDDADRHPGEIERAALLDVQLEVGVPGPRSAAPPTRSGSGRRRCAAAPRRGAARSTPGRDPPPSGRRPRCGCTPCRGRRPCSLRAPTAPSPAGAGWRRRTPARPAAPRAPPACRGRRRSCRRRAPSRCASRTGSAAGCPPPPARRRCRRHPAAA